MTTIIPLNRNLYPSDLDNIFTSFFGPSIFNRGNSKNSNLTNSVPLANVSENESGYEIDLAAPGLERENFQIMVENNTITVSGKNSEQKKGKYSEFNYSSFTRSWALPKGVNTEQISANYEAGILSIAIPTENKKKHKVNITVD